MPFVLTPQEQAAVDRILDAWEQADKGGADLPVQFHPLGVRSPRFRAKPSKENPNGAKYIDHGTIKYQAPDKGFFEAKGYLMDDPQEAPPGQVDL